MHELALFKSLPGQGNEPGTLFSFSFILSCLADESVQIIDIESLQNRLLKVCFVPATRAGLPRVSFFFFFVAVVIYSTNEANKAAVHAIKQSIYS